MNTDSLFQLIDKQAIEILKSFHHMEAGNNDASVLAKEKADMLGQVGDFLLWECISGRRRVPINRHLRFHDHNAIEGEWAGKKLGFDKPIGIFDCAAKLAFVHCQYWSFQTTIQGIKKEIDHRTSTSTTSSVIDQQHRTERLKELSERFVHIQRQIDVCNQVRNELIQIGDQMIRIMIEKEDRR